MKYTFTEIKRWAKSHGYDVLKAKGTEECVWTKIDDPSISGVAETLKDTATAIYNSITNGVWIEYQEKFKKEQSEKLPEWT